MATTAWMYGEDKRMIRYACMAMIIFRSELCLLFGPMLMISLYQRTISVPKAVFHGLKNVSISLALTIIIDSYFWRRLLWPEGEVLWFNTIRNQSSNWGVSNLKFLSCYPCEETYSCWFLFRLYHIFGISIQSFRGYCWPVCRSVSTV